jgi:transcriptional regulator with XRE-family HTH domain
VDFETFRNKLGKKIKKERIARGLTQEDMDDGDDSKVFGCRELA